MNILSVESPLQELVQFVLEDIGQDETYKKFLEVGCGSGAVTLCLLSKLPWVKKHPNFICNFAHN